MADLKKIVWRTRNKMEISTGLKAFDRQCKVVSTGNVISDTQKSSYIRSVGDTQCNGIKNSFGHLHEFDVRPFDGVPDRLKAFLALQGRSVILYQFHHWTGPSWRRRRILHGHIVTDGFYKLLAVVPVDRDKSRRILETVLPYIALPKPAASGMKMAA